MKQNQKCQNQFHTSDQYLVETISDPEVKGTEKHKFTWLSSMATILFLFFENDTLYPGSTTEKGGFSHFGIARKLVLGDRQQGGSGISCYHSNVWRIKRKRNNESLSPSTSIVLDEKYFLKCGGRIKWNMYLLNFEPLLSLSPEYHSQKLMIFFNWKFIKFPELIHLLS